MKIIAPLIFLLSFLQYGVAQKHESIAVIKKVITVKEAVTMLEHNGYAVYYNNADLKDTRVVTIPSDTIAVPKLLDVLIKGTLLEYVLKKKQIILRRASSFLHNKRNVTLSGYVRNIHTFENLIGATVVDTISRQEALTNQYGFFSITIPEHTPAYLLFSYVGHERNFISGIFHRDTTFSVSLADRNSLDTVIIQGQRDQLYTGPYKIVTHVDMTRAEKTLLLGEPDLFKIIQQSPGVIQGADGTASLYVRGGDAGTNLVLLDGAPIYFTSHMLNLFSVFSPQAINEAKFYKGYIPGWYGGRLSSVLDVSLREGNVKELKGEASIGLISSQLILEGPIVKEKASFIISVRRTYLDVLAYLIEKIGDVDDLFNYDFHDITLKANYIPTPRDRIYASSYLGRDFYKFDGSSSSGGIGSTGSSIENTNFSHQNHWENVMFTGRWNHIFNERTFSNFLITYSNFANEEIVHYKNYEETNGTGGNTSVIRSSSFSKIPSSLVTWGARLDLEQSVGYNHYFRYGLFLNVHNVRPEAREFETSKMAVVPLISANIYGKEASAYIQDKWTITDKLSVDFGFHVAYYYASRSFWKPQPRVSIILQQKKSYLSLSYMKQTQFITPLVSQGQPSELPTDSWFSVGRYRDSQKIFHPLTSHEITLGWKLPVNKDLTLSSNVFYKEMDNLITFIPAGKLFLYKGEALPDLLMTGSGKSYGWESEGTLSTGSSSFDAAYTLSWSYRQFEDINEGKQFPFDYDRRHTVRLGWQKKWARGRQKHWQFSTQWFLASGAKITVPSRSIQAY
jgi:hypothetical protein